MLDPPQSLSIPSFSSQRRPPTSISHGSQPPPLPSLSHQRSYQHYQKPLHNSAQTAPHFQTSLSPHSLYYSRYSCFLRDYICSPFEGFPQLISEASHRSTYSCCRGKSNTSIPSSTCSTSSVALDATYKLTLTYPIASSLRLLISHFLYQIYEHEPCSYLLGLVKSHYATWNRYLSSWCSSTYDLSSLARHSCWAIKRISIQADQQCKRSTYGNSYCP